MTFKSSLRILRENILRYFFNAIITVIYCLTVLPSYVYGPPGARSAAVIFQRTVSVITLADETKKIMTQIRERPFDSKEQSEEGRGRETVPCCPLCSRELAEEVSVCQRLDIIFYIETHRTIMVPCHR